MKLYAHKRHVYQVGHRIIEWAPGQCREVDDELGRVLLLAHSPKFCDVTAEVDVSEHICSKTAVVDRERYETQQLTPTNITPLPGTGRVSKQRLEIRRATYSRSRVARMNRANASRSA